MPTALNLTCSYPGPELLCLHFRGLRKRLWKELLFKKRFYSRSCIPGKALQWSRLMDTTPILHKPSLPPSPPTPGVPFPIPPLEEGAVGPAGPRLTFLPDSESASQSWLGVLSAGPPSVLLRGTSFSPRGAWPPWRETVSAPSGGSGISWVHPLPTAYPNSCVLWPSLHALWPSRENWLLCVSARGWDFFHLNVIICSSSDTRHGAWWAHWPHSLWLNPLPLLVSSFHLSGLWWPHSFPLWVHLALTGVSWELQALAGPRQDNIISPSPFRGTVYTT